MRIRQRVNLLICFLTSAISGCASGKIETHSTSQPADIEQLNGQIALAVKSAIEQQLTVQGIGYKSEYGIGAVITVVATLGVVALALILTIILSHRREMARIKWQDDSEK